jgi:hypothetical protein
MPTFLGATDFNGAYTPYPPAPGPQGESTYKGRIMFSNLPRGVVESVLPTDLQLANNTSATPAVHPVALLFGDQTHARWSIPGVAPLELRKGVQKDYRYREMIVIVPFVQYRGSPEWHNYVVGMFLNDLGATLGGNAFYGYRKELAKFRKTANLFKVSVEKHPIFTASLGGFGPWYPDAQADAALANYTDVKQILQMPVLGTEELPQPLPPYHVYVSSYFVFDFQNSEARSFTSQHQFLAPFGLASWVALGQISSVPGAFEVKELVWKLGLPVAYHF